MTDWTEDEVTDARRDVAALLHADLDRKQGDIDAILDGAGDRGSRCIAETLLGLAADLLVRLTVAVPHIADDRMQQLVSGADSSVFMEQLDIRRAVEENIARVQGEIIAEG